MVQAVERAFAVLEQFDADSPTISAAEIATRTGLARPTVYRLLQTLERLGYLRQVNGGYEVTHRVLRLGAGYLGQEGFARRAQQVVDALTGQVGEHSAVAVFDEGAVLAIAAAHSPRSRYLSVAVRVGQRLPADTTALGRVLLAFGPGDHGGQSPDRAADTGTNTSTVDMLPDEERATIVDAGYAVADGLLESGLISIGVPVRDRSGRVTGAVSVAASRGRVTADSLQREVLPHLLAAAGELERLG